MALFGSAGLTLSAIPLAAQTSDDASAIVSAAVLDEFTVEAIEDLDFGTVLAGTGEHQVPVDGEDAGIFQIVGQNNQDIDVLLTPPTDLVHEEQAAETIPYAWAAHFQMGTTEPDPEGELEEFTSTTGSFRLGNGQQGLQEFGFVFIHGTIDVGTNAGDVEPGKYEATFEAEVVFY